MKRGLHLLLPATALAALVAVASAPGCLDGSIKNARPSPGRTGQPPAVSGPPGAIPPGVGGSIDGEGPPAPGLPPPPSPPAPPVTVPPGMTPPPSPPPPAPGPPAPAPIPPNAREGLPEKAIVVYWGQNGAGGANPGDMSLYEKELDETCESNPHYDALVLAFAIDFGNPLNASGGPRLNFAFHCKTRYDDQNPFLKRCPEIERAIIGCQQKRKKVLLSLGGATGSYSFTDDAHAERFAETTWNMFLGGQSSVRPFGVAILDGVDLDIEGGLPGGYTAFVRKLRALMKTDPTRRYLVTGAPQCVFPDAYLGPGPGKVLGEAANLFDYLWVQFYNNHCALDGGTFNQMLASWTKVAGPRILIGLPASSGAGGGYVDPADLGRVVGLVRPGAPNPQGIMLWDASYDRLNVINGQTYGARIATLLGK